MQHTVIPSWYQREGYITAMANLIEKELQSFDSPEKVLLTSFFTLLKLVLGGKWLRFRFMEMCILGNDIL